MPTCLIGLGSNLGDRAENLSRAVELLEAFEAISVAAVSGFFQTSPAGGPAGQANFLNAAVRIETTLPPAALLQRLLDVESKLGRDRGGERWSARAIDLDLLLYGDEVVDSPSLVVPHRRMSFRRFVLEPAADIAGDLVHPTIGWTIDRLLTHLDSAPRYVAIAGPDAEKTDLAREVSTTLHDESGFLCRLLLNPEGAPGSAADAEFPRLQLLVTTLGEDRWPETEWVVSDFWFEQDVFAVQHGFTAQHGLDTAARQRFQAEVHVVRKKIVSPRLLVVLDGPAEALIPNLTGHGPMLLLDQQDRSRWCAEIVAAIQAMA